MVVILPPAGNSRSECIDGSQSIARYTHEINLPALFTSKNLKSMFSSKWFLS